MEAAVHAALPAGDQPSRPRHREALLRADAGLPIEVSPFPLPRLTSSRWPPGTSGVAQASVVRRAPATWHFPIGGRRLVLPARSGLCSWSSPPPAQCTLALSTGDGLWPIQQSRRTGGRSSMALSPGPRRGGSPGCIAVNPVFTARPAPTNRCLLSRGLQCPGVSTGVGCEGTGFSIRRHCLLADTSKILRRPLPRLLALSSLCEQLANGNAHDRLRQTFSADRVRRATRTRSLRKMPPAE